MKDRLRVLSNEYDMLPAGALVLCAVSGGADSMCLLHLLYTMAPEAGFTLRAAHFNHHLRGEESLRDEEFVRSWCREHEIPFVCGGADVAAEAVRTGRGIEETARSLRYAFLERTAETLGASRIATAHTANDNAETVLLHLVRGSGLQGLTGIPPRRGNVVRPLLTVTRVQVEEYCTVHGIPYMTDSTNSDEGYTRNFLRRQVIPLLNQINPRAVEHLSAAADRLRDDNEYLADTAARAVEQSRAVDGGVEIDVCVLTEAAEPIAARVARQLVERAGGGKNCTSAHIHALLDLCRSADPSGRVDLPGLTARRMYDKLVLATAEKAVEQLRTVCIQEGEQTKCGGSGWSVLCRKTICPNEKNESSDMFYLACSKITGTLTVRPRQTGDFIKLPGRPGKTLKKLMIDEKVPLDDRDRMPVLVDETGVLALAGFGPDVSHVAEPGEAAWKVIFMKVNGNEL